jgi:hypothetical protein
MAFLVITGTPPAAYAFNTAHSGLSIISGYMRLAHASANLASKVISASGSAFIFDAADTTLASVTASPSGAVGHAYVVCKSGASEAEHVLLSYNDLTAPITANGGNITLQHGSPGILQTWM